MCFPATALKSFPDSCMTSSYFPPPTRSLRISSFSSGFLNLSTIDTLGLVILGCGRLSVCWSMFSHMPDLHLLHTRNNSPSSPAPLLHPSCGNQICLWTLLKVLEKANLPFVENLCFRTSSKNYIKVHISDYVPLGETFSPKLRMSMLPEGLWRVLMSPKMIPTHSYPCSAGWPLLVPPSPLPPCPPKGGLPFLSFHPAQLTPKRKQDQLPQVVWCVSLPGTKPSTY